MKYRKIILLPFLIFSFFSNAQNIDSVGFYIYSDDFESYITANNWSGGIADFQSIESPNNGEYCIHWENANLFGALNIDFVPDRDFSYLIENDYALDMMVRGNHSNIWFDIRFLDSDEGPNDHPWRMRAIINQNHGPWDGRWHHLHIPLDEMGESGAWDDNMWFPSTGGNFDWSKVDRIQIVPEKHALTDMTLWFDNIHITNLDTALVYDDSVFGPVTSLINTEYEIDFHIFPNPTTDFITIQSRKSNSFNFILNNSLGQNLRSGKILDEETISLKILDRGIYWLSIYKDQQLIRVEKIIKK